ncbi:MAG: EamA family transporter [Proteobacteria bacterium]|nr:EamA family transporter [Pseudomonadota bacterium]
MVNNKITLGHLALSLMVVIFWGFNFMFAKIALQHFTPFLMLTIRFLATFLILFPFYRKPPLPIKQIIIISFTFSVMHLGCMFWSLYLGLDSSIAIVAQQLSIPFLFIVAVMIFKEKIDKAKTFGVAISIIGTFILMGSPNSIANPFAFLLIIGSAFSWALYSMELRRLKSPSALSLVAWMSLFSFIMNLPITLIFEENHLNIISDAQLMIWMALLYTVFCSSIAAHGLWGYLLKHNQVNHIAPMILLVPIFGVFAGTTFLQESLTMEMVVGGVFIILGVAMTLINRAKKQDLALLNTAE